MWGDIPQWPTVIGAPGQWRATAKKGQIAFSKKRSVLSSKLGLRECMRPPKNFIPCTPQVLLWPWLLSLTLRFFFYFDFCCVVFFVLCVITFTLPLINSVLRYEGPIIFAYSIIADIIEPIHMKFFIFKLVSYSTGI